jgi:hypothetical protein
MLSIITFLSVLEYQLKIGDDGFVVKLFIGCLDTSLVGCLPMELAIKFLIDLSSMTTYKQQIGFKIYAGGQILKVT